MSSGVAIVTGGAQGLGAEICRTLLGARYQVAVTDVQEEKGLAFAEHLKSEFGEDRVIFRVCDVTCKERLLSVFSDVESLFGSVDVLVNNAGIIREQDPALTLKVNLMGPLLGCQVAFERMGRSHGKRGGVVINVASLAGFVPLSCIPSYTASKHGVVGLTRALGLPFHYEKEGVTVAALCPWFIDTPILDCSERDTLDPDIDLSKIPDKLEASYVAKGILKILDDRINGSLLCVAPDIDFQYVGYQEEIKGLKFR